MQRLPGRVAALAGSRRHALAIALGGVTALAQPPVSLPVVLFLALPPLAWLLDGTQGWRGAALLGWLAGAGHFAAALFWIVDPFLVEPEVFGWMAPFALAGMAGGLALFWVAPFALARAWWPPGSGRLLALAALWALADLARAYVLTGFPWGLPAYAWVETPVIQVVALVGPHGLGLLTLVAALLPATLSARAVVVAVALVAAAWAFGAWRLSQPLPPRAHPVTVRLVQPDADQALKWQPGMAQAFYERHLALTRAEPRADITVWSETAVPFALESSPELLAESAAAAAPGTLILGILRSEPAPGGGERWFNSLAVLRSDGTPAAVYDKYRLVPFGEYIPFPGLVARLGVPALVTLTGGGFSPGSGPHLVAAPGVPPFLPLICYEAIFPQGLTAPEGRPEWLLQVTNDAWFGEASGPYQHLAQARARAIERGLPLARAANTGISAMVDPYGRVVAALDLGEMGVVDTTLPSSLPPTPYSRTGDLFALIAIFSMLGLTLINLYRGNVLRAPR
jgi:apolipoprotein N-acyltransferase